MAGAHQEVIPVGKFHSLNLPDLTLCIKTQGVFSPLNPFSVTGRFRTHSRGLCWTVSVSDVIVMISLTDVACNC